MKFQKKKKFHLNKNEVPSKQKIKFQFNRKGVPSKQK